MAQTSDRVSSIAARYANMTAERVMAAAAKSSTAEIMAGEIRTLAASALRQDETKGLRGLVRKLVGV